MTIGSEGEVLTPAECPSLDILFAGQVPAFADRGLPAADREPRRQRNPQREEATPEGRAIIKAPG
jgi:hypothetical protein